MSGRKFQLCFSFPEKKEYQHEEINMCGIQAYIFPQGQSDNKNDKITFF